MDPFLRPTDVIDWKHPAVLAQARSLRDALADPVAIAKCCFEWVRDEIKHGLCYQRLSRDGNGAPYSLHGLNAVLLPGVGWYRVDPRGNRTGINAQFAPPAEHLAFSTNLAGEADLPEIWADPLPVVIEALRTHTTADSLWEDLPDLTLWRTSPWDSSQPDAWPGHSVHCLRRPSRS